MLSPYTNAGTSTMNPTSGFAPRTPLPEGVLERMEKACNQSRILPTIRARLKLQERVVSR